MKTLSEGQQKMFDWDNELRFDSADYPDRQVIGIAQEAIDFAYSNFTKKE